MKKGKKHIAANLGKASAAISFSHLLFIALFAACSTPTVSSDDSDEESSFSEKTEQDESLSSSGKITSSSSAGGMNCSALLNGETDWNWDIPKECRFNPDIDYGTMTDERDGKVYRTVKIGDQIWMAENLNFDPGQGGYGEDKYDWSWCYNDDPRNCDVAGRLYTWAAAIDSVTLATDKDNPLVCGYGRACELPSMVRGICPSGWHLPTETEWFALLDDVGGLNNAGENLKSLKGWYNGDNGTDDVGFSVLPVGYKNGEVPPQYDGVGIGASFWTATEVDSYRTNSMGLFYDIYILYYFDRKNHGFSIRCLKD